MTPKSKSGHPIPSHKSQQLLVRMIEPHLTNQWKLAHLPALCVHHHTMRLSASGARAGGSLRVAGEKRREERAREQHLCASQLVTAESHARSCLPVSRPVGHLPGQGAECWWPYYGPRCAWACKARSQPFECISFQVHCITDFPSMLTKWSLCIQIPAHVLDIQAHQG